MGFETLTANGKFIGLWGPAKQAKCCCRKVSLSDGLWWLAVYQIIFAAGSLCYKIISWSHGSSPSGISEPLVEIALALWMLRGIKFTEKEPIIHFAFVQSLIAVKGSIDCFFTTIYLVDKAAGGDDEINGAGWAAVSLFGIGYYYFTIPCKVYSAYVAWSFVALNFPELLLALPTNNSPPTPSKFSRLVLRAENLLFGDSETTATIPSEPTADDESTLDDTVNGKMPERPASELTFANDQPLVVKPMVVKIVPARPDPASPQNSTCLDRPLDGEGASSLAAALAAAEERFEARLAVLEAAHGSAVDAAAKATRLQVLPTGDGLPHAKIPLAPPKKASTNPFARPQFMFEPLLTNATVPGATGMQDLGTPGCTVPANFVS